jgi:glycine/D-amino acid oxidase-like deaminating enzyme
VAERDVFWLDRPRPARRPALQGSITADVVVVGGGFTGLWTALTLLEAEPAGRVVLLEAGRVGVGASGRNGGFLDPSLTHGLANGVRHFPHEVGELDRLATQNYAGFREALRRHDIDCAFEPTGMLEVASEPWQVAGLREWFDLHVRHGHDAEFLDAVQARERLASPRVHAAVRRPTAGGVLDPVALVDGLAAAVERLGAVVHEGSAVVGITRTGDHVVARTAGGDVRARHAVLAADAWSRDLVRSTRHRYINIYDYVLMTRPLEPGELAGIGWKDREGVSDSGNHFHYFRLTADDRILWGGYDAVRHRADAVGERFDRWPPTHDRLERHFRAFFPALAGVEFTHRWGGPIAVTSRFTPTFGAALGGRLQYALGYTGLGVAATRFAATVLTDWLLGRPSPVLDLDYVGRSPVPFPPEPLRSIVVGATQRAITKADARDGRRGPWLRLLDRLGVGLES